MMASWTMLAGLAIGQVAGPGDRPAALLALAQRSGGAIEVKWHGQDGSDFVGNMLGQYEPSEIQDIHFELTGIPADHQIRQIIVVAEGGNEWEYNGPKSHYPAVLKRTPGETTADLYIEPMRNETGRIFHVKITLDDGRMAEVAVQGRKADMTARRADVSLSAKWEGQSRQDIVGPGPSVGADGLQDVQVALSGLSPKKDVKLATLEGPNGARWESGLNPNAVGNAEFVRDEKDKSRAELWFQPDRDLKGQKLRLSIQYNDGQRDAAPVTAGRIDPKLKMPTPPLPTLAKNAMSARWLGQDGASGAPAGSVHVALSGVPSGQPVAAVLTDSARGCWAYKADDRAPVEIEPDAKPMAVARGSGRGHADLFFEPTRDEAGATLTLRLVYQGGEMAVARFAGGACDPHIRGDAPASNSVVAKPGDDLNDLAGRFGTVRLAKGTHRVARPIVLEKPVHLVGEPGATLLFEQGSNDPPWPAAITVHAGRTTLEGFAIRFAGPIRWDTNTPWGAAVIGATPINDGAHPGPRIGLTFTKLDVEGPPASDPSAWVEAIRLMRLVNAKCGRITQNTLRGGGIEMFEGPWEIADNEFRGTPPGTWSPGVFTCHASRDVAIVRNRAKSVAPSGKTWRFLVLGGIGFNDRVEENVIEGLGPRDDDTIPNMNMPEIILTESYRIQFEGRPAAVSADGRVVRVAQAYGEPVRTGDLVAVLTGPNAGWWSTIAQAINRTTYLLDRPLPAGSDAISVTSGFVGLLIRDNAIDARGSSKAVGLVLPGNQFGLRVLNNRIAGGGEAFHFTACTTETPRTWGWSHAPYFGALVEGNTFEDADRGGWIDVEHNEHIKSGKGRTYMVLTFRDNSFRWTAPFLGRRAGRGEKELPVALRVGSGPVHDPGDLVLYEQGNALQAPRGVHSDGVVQVVAAWIDGKRFVKRALPLPTGLAMPSPPPARPASSPTPAPAPKRPTRPAPSTAGRAGAATR